MAARGPYYAQRGKQLTVRGVAGTVDQNGNWRANTTAAGPPVRALPATTHVALAAQYQQAASTALQQAAAHAAVGNTTAAQAARNLAASHAATSAAHSAAAQPGAKKATPVRQTRAPVKPGTKLVSKTRKFVPKKAVAKTARGPVKRTAGGNAGPQYGTDASGNPLQTSGTSTAPYENGIFVDENGAMWAGQISPFDGSFSTMEPGVYVNWGNYNPTATHLYSTSSSGGTAVVQGDQGVYDTTDSTGTPITSGYSVTPSVPAAPVYDPTSGQYVDPTTGQPVGSASPVYDPTSGQYVDPTTGLPVSNTSYAPTYAAPPAYAPAPVYAAPAAPVYDSTSGQYIDPTTGQPVAPPYATAYPAPTAPYAAPAPVVYPTDPTDSAALLYQGAAYGAETAAAQAAAQQSAALAAQQQALLAQQQQAAASGLGSMSSLSYGMSESGIDPNTGVPYSMEGPIDPSTGIPYSMEGSDPLTSSVLLGGGVTDMSGLNGLAGGLDPTTLAQLSGGDPDYATMMALQNGAYDPTGGMLDGDTSDLSAFSNNGVVPY